MIPWSVELDADPNTTGLFMVGSSLLGGTDLIAADERWIQVPTLRVLSVSVRRGGTAGTRTYDAGEAVVELDNMSGDFDPDNASGQYVMGPRRLLGQGTGLRLKANASGTLGAGGGTYDSAVTGDGALGYWRLDEPSGTVGTDTIGAVNGAFTGTYTRGAAAIGVGLGLSTTFTNAMCTTSAPAGTLNAPYSVELWFVPTSTTANAELVWTRTPEFGMDIQLISNGTVFTALHGDVGNGVGAWISNTVDATGLNITAGSVNHVVYSVAAASYAIYLNGVSVGSGSLSGAGRFWDTGRAMVLGKNTNPFIGRMSNVAVYPSALTGAQALTHYTRGATAAVADSTVFVGKIEEPSIKGHWAHPTAVFTAVDTLSVLGNLDVPPQRGGATGDGESSNARAHWLLDQASVPTSKRSVAAAGRANLATTGGEKVRVGLDRVAAGEAGRFYVDRTGTVVLTWHDAEYAKVVQAAFDNTTGGPDYHSIESSTGVIGITNSATVHRIVPQVRDPDTGQFSEGPDLDDAGAQDWDSVATYGRRATTVDVTLSSDGDVAALATFLATRRSAPTQRLVSLGCVPLEAMSVAQAQALLEIDLGELITVAQHTIDGRLIFWTANVEHIAWDHNSPMTRLTLSTSPSDTASLYGSVGWFLIGTSLLGGTDVLAPY